MKFERENTIKAWCDQKINENHLRVVGSIAYVVETKSRH